VARIAGVDIPKDKHVEISLQHIFGIGSTRARRILTESAVDPTTKVRDLTDDEVNRIREFMDRSYKVEGDLRKEINLNIKRMIEIGCYRGARHRLGLPARGQRTRTNARTKRGSRHTVAGRGKRRGVAKK
jgi:small subunit ribosomal protein S13